MGTMRNLFRLKGETAILLVDRRSGEQVEVIIDRSDLQRLVDLGKTWGVTKNGYRDEYFVQTTFGKDKLKLHRFLMKANDDELVIHINGNTYDNRKSNLRVIAKSESSRFRKSVNKNSSTGIRGVSLDPRTGRFKAYITVNRKQIHIGVYDKLTDAKRAVIEARKKYYGGASDDV
jgi:hypothetical protein